MESSYNNTDGTASYGFRLEDWIDTAGITNDAFDFTDASYNVPANPITASESSKASQPDPIWNEEVLKSLTLSTAFPEVPPTPNQRQYDVVFISSDNVVFYVDQNILLKHSTNCFDGLLPITAKDKPDRVRPLADVSSSELNIILHALYNRDASRYQTPLASIISAINHLPKYGCAPKSLITPSNSMYRLLLSHSPLYPLDIYSLCGKHDIYELATSVSSHLLSLELSTLTDEDAERMGSVYLARLFRLHKARVTTLIESLMPPPALHNPTRECGFDNQKTLSSAWTMATAYLLWSAKPDLPTGTIRGIFDAMTQHITCKDCLQGRDERVNKIVMTWSLSKCTI